ncbi:PhiH1 repressor-like protein [Halanaeroarchaeum sulfurireducens]|uniref:PhiH1 repressor-like protein n=1 Tax=Halanaeroarchaeum sulfurireducens TaxID=1604004 RepID=A0A0F7P761_9EURY|nr:PhiH1 repressor-like protein [Halanaeroarchaeum sulfurireducens]ALG80939.1 PhiH1 repressor-like protein [Halanaeroarchaeum sulfurireducens]
MLEKLRERGNLNPIHSAAGINRDRNDVSSRRSFLVDLGLVENLGHGLYSITEEGEAFLNGDLDAG